MKRYWEWGEAFDWTPRQTALLVVDMQRGFTDAGAPLEVPMAREQVPVIASLIEAFRAQDLTVIYTRFVARRDHFFPFYRARAPQRGLLLSHPEWMFQPEGDDARIDSRLAPRDGEVVVDKVAYDGFSETDLEEQLRARDIDTLVHVGTVVNWCVDSTLRAAFHRRFNNIVIADGVSGYDHAGASGQGWVDRELDFFAESMATVMPSGAFLETLDQLC